MNVKVSIYSFQATWLISNYLHVPWKHPVAFWATSPRKSESVYYDLQYLLFLGHFWTSLGLVIISPETLLRYPNSTCKVAQLPRFICVASKILWTPICSFLVKPQNCLKMNIKASTYRSKPHDSFPMTSHDPRRHTVAFGFQTPKKSENVYYNLQFCCFCDIFGLLRAWSYFVPKHY